MVTHESIRIKLVDKPQKTSGRHNIKELIFLVTGFSGHDKNNMSLPECQLA